MELSLDKADSCGFSINLLEARGAHDQDLMQMRQNLGFVANEGDALAYFKEYYFDSLNFNFYLLGLVCEVLL